MTLNQELWVLDEKERVRKEMLKRSGKLFKPDVVDAFMRISEYDAFWLEIENITLEELLNEALEEEGNCKKLRIAGFLHDFGKVAIANEIIDKKEPLNESEYNQIKAHSFYTHKILGNIKSISDICLWASMHHERHDGSGYTYGLKESDFCEEIDIVACADVFTALRENRQYRVAYPLVGSIELMNSNFRNKLGNKILDLVIINAKELDEIREEVQKNALESFSESLKYKV